MGFKLLVDEARPATAEEQQLYPENDMARDAFCNIAAVGDIQYEFANRCSWAKGHPGNIHAITRGGGTTIVRVWTDSHVCWELVEDED